MIKIIAIGDVVGKAGRQALAKSLPLIRERIDPDIVIVNGENAAGGFGITKKIYKQFIENFSIDCVTTGNHWHDKREIFEFLPQAERLVVPANMSNVESIEMGYKILEDRNGNPFAVINLIGNAFMQPGNRNLFKTIDLIMDRIPQNVKVRIVDVHAEATSEKQGVGRYLAGNVSLVFGTHSHVQTADERILEDATGYITDIGMTGPYESVIGIKTEAAIARMKDNERKRFEPASKDLWTPFIEVSVDPKSGLCHSIKRYRWELSKLINDDQK
ncbi:MAG: YmdB family metallophosphoesterase [Pseudobacteriovorax sp.]|nr:YmdB family metallophosphoesterase [Pseudobacteriovorax sp.]